ncbi:MAG: hypothetical protein E7236_09325 [Lachnospiraceae bacterium]|nr:hypothetical protein [Lachnospiraceae bacterium]
MNRLDIYNALVNRHSGIRERYHAYHDDAAGGKKVSSWLYLLSLNIRYYVFRQKGLDQSMAVPFYEEKEIPCETSESALAAGKIGTVDAWVEELAVYDQITFDLFDTLIFRPFSEPTDVFRFVGEKFAIMNFKQLRMEMEYKARLKAKEERGTMEVTLSEIWQMMEREIGIPAEEGMQTELAFERQFCYANPFMFEVWQKLIARGKKPTVVSDMYLPSSFLRELLDENGFLGYEDMFVSCEEVVSKSDGGIYHKLKEAGFGGKNLSWIHVGDNLHSDGKMAEAAGVKTHLYPNADHAGKKYRAYDMSPVIGGAYRGLVNHTLYSGIKTYSMEYEYGFVYGGLFAVGYCHFIHEYCRKHEIDRVLFLSRDGDILEKVYRKLYPEEDTVYVYWSRLAGMKLMAAFDKNDYFRRFIDHKANQGKTIGQILADMELDSQEKESFVTLLDVLHGKHQVSISSGDLLTDKNAPLLKAFLQDYFDHVLMAYQEQMDAAKSYYQSKLSGCRRAVAVDIGWAGSGAMAIAYLAEHVWKIPCRITGIIAGTNTVHNAEPEASEMFLQTGHLVSYLYSQADNRDLLKKHDPAKGYNVFWELLLASPTRQFCGFYSFAGQTGGSDENDLEPSDVPGVYLRFGSADPNQEGMREVQQGILDFTDLWMKHFKEFPYMFRISGRDAYAPLLAAAGDGEKYLKAIRRKFDLKEDIN